MKIYGVAPKNGDAVGTCKQALFVLSSFSKEEVEKCKEKDLLEEMLREMTGEFPPLSEVFVSERDLFLTNSLRQAARPIPNPKAETGMVFMSSRTTFVRVHYRPQTKFAKVMLLHLSVILFTGGGCLPQCMLEYTHPTPEQTPPPEETPPGRDTPLPCAVRAGRYGQQAGGTHSTGIAFRLIHRESNLMFTLSSDKDQKKIIRHCVRFLSV